jgi:hypothetical protein
MAAMTIIIKFLPTPHRKRESLHDVNGCGAAHIRLRLRPRWARHPINS